MSVSTTAASKKIAMSAAQFERLRKVIHERSGIFFQESKKYVLESRLGHRLQELEFDDYDQYISFLTIGPYREDEFQEMFNRITINETSFFRNQPQLDYFENAVLADLLQSRASSKRLRVWSCACSSGEEPFTLAIQLHRTLGVRLSDWHIEILGTDISEKMLAIGQAGRYSPYALRSTPPMVKQRYFKESGGFFDLDPGIREMVTFQQLNLRDHLSAVRFGKFDVIFCRNVLIYFDDDMKQRCAELFERMLAPDGYLLIGHSETLRNLKTGLEVVPVPQAFCWRRPAAM
jgi:chemotaxis protein methyltransferase CheR